MLTFLTRIFLRPFFLWECSCMDPQHSGDDPDCPQHGKRAKWMRFFVLALLVIAFLLLRSIYG